jgi:hypothetical protein
MPSSIEYFYVIGGIGGINATYSRYVATGLNQLNGTYFADLTKTSGGCLNGVSTPVIESISLTIDRYRRSHTGSFTACDFPSGTEFLESTWEPNYEVTVDWTGGMGGISTVLQATSPSFPPFAGWLDLKILGQTILRCSKAYDMDEADDTNTTLPGLTYYLNSGEIWLVSGSQNNCGTSGAVLSPYYLAGTIASDVVAV